MALPKIDLKKVLAKIPKPVRIAIVIVPALVISVLYIYLSIIPKTKQINVLKQEIARQDTEITKKKSMVARLDALKAEHEKILQILKELEERLPEEKEIASLLKQISELARDSGLDIKVWTPAARSMHPSGIVFQVPFTVSLDGSYHDLGAFFSSLTNLDRIVNINNITLGGPRQQAGRTILGVSFSAITFTAVPQEAAK